MPEPKAPQAVASQQLNRTVDPSPHLQTEIALVRPVDVGEKTELAEVGRPDTASAIPDGCCPIAFKELSRISQSRLHDPLLAEMAISGKGHG
jgi:hypothetical protein